MSQEEKYHPMPELLSKEIIERISKLSPALLCDGMKGLGVSRDGCMEPEIMSIDDQKILIGTAYTVDTEDGDNFPINEAIYMGKSGYVLVVAGKGYRERAYMGDLMCSAAAAVGLNGVVIDGYVRDKAGLQALDIPVYTKGFVQRGPNNKGPGAINMAVVCGGVRVEPGDLIFGDCDGITVVPRNLITQVLENAEKRNDFEIERRKVIEEYANCLLQGKEPPDITAGKQVK